MRLGLSTYTFPWNIELSGILPSCSFSFHNMLQFACDKQINYFQFGDNYPLHLLSDPALEDLRKTAQDKNIHLQVGTRGLLYENISLYLSIAQKLGSDFLRIVIDDVNYHPSEEEVTGIIKQLIPVLKETGIVLAIENHDRFKAKTLVHIIEQTDPQWVAICLDTTNSLAAGEGIMEIAPALLPYTINVHVKDFTVTRAAHKMGFIVAGTPAGDGLLDIAWLLNECSRYARCKTATLELWIDRDDLPEKTVAKENEWINKSIKFLNNYIQ